VIVCLKSFDVLVRVVFGTEFFDQLSAASGPETAFPLKVLIEGESGHSAFVKVHREKPHTSKL